jgi:ATP-binding cassette subfamily B protein RaxB
VQRLSKLRLGWFERRRAATVLQSAAGECGPACVASVAAAHGLQVDLAILRQRLGWSVAGGRLADLLRLCNTMGLLARALRVEVRELRQLRLPLILHWRFEHFVVLQSIGVRHVRIMDPALGWCRLSRARFEEAFTGVAIEVLPGPAFRPSRQHHKLRLSELFGGLPGLRAALLRLAALTLIVQALILAVPLFTQLVIDDVLVAGDRHLLDLLAGAFLGLGLGQALFTAWRSVSVFQLAAGLRVVCAARVFQRLLRLPVAYFHGRRLGDIMSRFDSLQAVQRLLTHTLVEACMDALMAGLALALMLFYAPFLSLVVLASVTSYALVCAASIPALRRRTWHSLATQAREKSLFMETVRCLQAIKLNTMEQQRESLWQNRLVASANGMMDVARVMLWQQTLRQTLFAGERIVVVWLAARGVLAGELTVGMLVAFLAYRQHLVDRASALIGSCVEIAEIGVHRERLAELLRPAPEPHYGQAKTPEGAVTASLSLDHVWFRHSVAQPWIFAGLSLDLDVGECVLVSGPSGCGKSTLIRLMLGLLEPQRGRISCASRDIRGMLGEFRQVTAAVLQDDTLLNGTIADNIAGFEPLPDATRIRRCAREACIDTVVRRLPMGYRSRIGASSATLSGGETQRLLIARALYRQPRLLFLDEATSQLDASTEARVFAAIRARGITCVVVAHRETTARYADRTIPLAHAAATN